MKSLLLIKDMFLLKMHLTLLVLLLKFSSNYQKTANVSLVVYNAQGIAVSTIIDNQKLGAGRYSETLNLSGLTNGYYFYQLTTGEVSLTRSMVINK